MSKEFDINKCYNADTAVLTKYRRELTKGYEELEKKATDNTNEDSRNRVKTDLFVSQRIYRKYKSKL